MKWIKNTWTICGVLRDLVLYAQFKKHEKHPWKSLILAKLQASASKFAKISTPPWLIFTFFKL